MPIVNLTCERLRVIWLCAICLALGCEGSGAPTASPAFESAAVPIKGVVLDAREAPSDSVLAAVHDLGATHIALVSFGFMPEEGRPDIRFSRNPRWFSESADGMRGLAERAGDLDMKIVVKPQIWMQGGEWTADIDFDTENDWIRWEADYRAYLLDRAALAEEIGADLLIIGTELSNPVRKRPDFFRRLIQEIRSVYSGSLTYGANWHDDYEDVAFWDDLDYVGVQAYFPISEVAKPTEDDLLRGWNSHLADLEAVSLRTNLPILFTEIGYRSVHYAAAEPWRWPSREENDEPDYRLQAALFRAFFDRVWRQPWFGGAIVWKLYPHGAMGRHELDFTPQGKPAEEVIRRGFGGGE